MSAPLPLASSSHHGPAKRKRSSTNGITWSSDKRKAAARSKGAAHPLKHPKERWAHFTYDTKGRLQCENVRMNSAAFPSSATCTLGTAGSFGPDRITRYEYSLADEVTKQTAAYLTADAADEATLTYTNNGLLQTLKDAENNKTT
jgi:hypothetical protein